MSEPTTDDVPGVTTDEMLAWLDGIMEVGASLEWSQIDSYDAAIARAIAARLRQASGKAEPAPTYDAQPPGLTVLAPKREKE